MGERTGSRVLQWVWSYVAGSDNYPEYIVTQTPTSAIRNDVTNEYLFPYSYMPSTASDDQQALAQLSMAMSK
ncbi:hypothetical protein CCHR01_18162 [Colletotrichum chrysophilum]|uniref:Uncharacterized protein n=1 Tax=Colletotrichum chrysophilum TaxID=1836956 RepID=A0AAD9A156_9PEZI|nr:hypothetical protein CCHR01_18162 [Colletotrichum chrysophilum]